MASDFKIEEFKEFVLPAKQFELLLLALCKIASFSLLLDKPLVATDDALPHTTNNTLLNFSDFCKLALFSWTGKLPEFIEDVSFAAGDSKDFCNSKGFFKFG